MMQVVGVALWIVGMVVGWRMGYVWGYEAQAAKDRDQSSIEEEARFRGIISAILWPALVPALLVGKYLTPTPPSLVRKLQDDNARRIEQLERELGLIR